MATTQNSNQERPPNTPPSSPWWRFSWWWLALLVALLIPNYWAGSEAMKEPSRVRVPYSPFFLQQVRAGNVVDITSKGTAIQGTFAHPESYDGSKPTTRFKGLDQELVRLTGVTHYRPAAAVSLHQTGTTGPYELESEDRV